MPNTPVRAGKMLSVISLICLLALALWLRVEKLSATPIFTDEAININWALEMLLQRTRDALFLPARDFGKQPLFMCVAAASMGVIPDHLTAARLVSAISGTISALGTYMLGTTVFGRRVGLLAAALYALLPLAIFHERMALIDPLLSALLLFSLVASSRVASATSRVGQLSLALVSGLLLGAAVWTKSSSLLFAGFPALSWILLRQKHTRIPPLVAASCYLPLAVAVALLASTPNAKQIAVQTAGFVQPLTGDAGTFLSIVSTNLTKLESWISSYCGYGAVIAALAACLFRPTRRTWFLCCYAFAPALVFALLGERIYSRYVLPSAAPMSVLLAAGVASAVEAASRRLGSHLCMRGALAISAIAAVLWPWVGFSATMMTDPTRLPLSPDDRYQYISGWPSGYGLRDAFSLVEETASSLGSPVILLTDTFAGLPRDAARIYFHGNSTVVHRTEMAVVWGGSSIAEDWKPHRVITFVLVSDYRDNWQAFERNCPEFRLLSVHWKPENNSFFRLYSADFRPDPAETVPAANRTAGAR